MKHLLYLLGSVPLIFAASACSSDTSSSNNNGDPSDASSSDQMDASTSSNGSNNNNNNGTNMGGNGRDGSTMTSDAGSQPDSGTATDSGAGSDAAAMCVADLECSGFPQDGYPTDADGVDNCVGHIHQADCCGATRVIGINHGARDTLCPAEEACQAAYPTPTCSDDTITTDTGETTTDIGDVRVRCDPAGQGNCQCQTFLCTNGDCMNSSRPIGSCG